MKIQKFYISQKEEETHGKDHEDSDQHSSSESCNNVAISTQKKEKYSCEAVSSRAKSGFVIPEKNKRETNTQFRELSSVVPGLNMKEEDLMLDDVIDYLKRLQERANILEQQNKTICVEKAWVFGDNEIGESPSSSIYQFKKGLPEIEAKAQGKNVLIRVHCENKKRHIAKVIGEIEKLLHLNIENISSLPFGDHFLDITVTAQISGDDFFMTMKDLKRELREALQLFM